MGDARVRIDDLGGPVRVLRIDLGGDQHRLVAERPRVEDRRDLADDPARRGGAGCATSSSSTPEVRLARDQGEGLGRRAESSTGAGSSGACRCRPGERRPRPCGNGALGRAAVLTPLPLRELLRVVGEDHVGAGPADGGQRLDHRGALVDPAVLRPPPSASSTRPTPGRRQSAGRWRPRTRANPGPGTEGPASPSPCPPPPRRRARPRGAPRRRWPGPSGSCGGRRTRASTPRRRGTARRRPRRTSPSRR